MCYQNSRDPPRGAVTAADDDAVCHTFCHVCDAGSKMDILNALSMMYVDGTTNTANAISVMRTDAFNTGNGDRVSRPNVGVVITDGW